MDFNFFINTKKPIQRYAMLSIVASLLTLGLKVSAYLLTGSISVLSDALETFMNIITAGITYIVLVISAMPADDNHQYGHEKVEYFSSAAEGLLIIVASLTIFYGAVIRFFKPVTLEYLLSGTGIILGATLINATFAYIMKKAGDLHDSIALKAEAEHLISDVWTSVAVIASIFCIRFFPSWQILDPIIALIIAISTFKVGFQLLKSSADGLMDMALPISERQEIINILECSLPPLFSFNQLKTRKSGSKRFIEFTVLVPGKLSVSESHLVCDVVKKRIGEALENSSISIYLLPKEMEKRIERDIISN